MIVSLFGVNTVYATDTDVIEYSGSCGENVTYTFDADSNTLTISGTGDMENYSGSNIPWEKYKYSITNVVIENGVTSVGKYAFFYCTNLTDVILPDSLVTISAYAFSYCYKLSNITEFKNVTKIDNYAFRSCRALENVTIPVGVSRIQESVFYDCISLKNIYVNSDNECFCSLDGVLFTKDLKTLKHYPSGKEDTTYKIPDGVTILESWSFSYAENLVAIEIPDSVTYIGLGAFYYCTNLLNITLPQGVSSIKSSCFSSCKSLISINIPDSVKFIEEYAFCNCTSLNNVTIPDGNEKLYYGTFWGCISLTNIKLPDSVTVIGEKVFNNCTGLTNITIPKNVTTLERCAFSGCANLVEIVIPQSVTIIGDDAFIQCAALKEIVIPDTVTTIGQYAFGYECNDSNPLNVMHFLLEDFTIYCKSSSAAENYAKTNGIKYFFIEESNKEETPAIESGTVKIGMDLSVADNVITTHQKETDLKGSVYRSLQAKVSKTTKNSLKITWKKVSEAKKYVVYGAKCGNKMKKLKTVKTTTFINKKLSESTYFKYIVVAVDKEDKIVSVSKIIHSSTLGNNKKSNPIGLKTEAKKNKVTIKAKKTFNLKARCLKKKGTTIKIHRGVKYECSNTKIAIVNGKGKITAKKKGVCYVYVYAQNGVAKKVKVSVK